MRGAQAFQLQPWNPPTPTGVVALTLAGRTLQQLAVELLVRGAVAGLAIAMVKGALVDVGSDGGAAGGSGGLLLFSALAWKAFGGLEAPKWVLVVLRAGGRACVRACVRARRVPCRALPATRTRDAWALDSLTAGVQPRVVSSRPRPLPPTRTRTRPRSCAWLLIAVAGWHMYMGPVCGAGSRRRPWLHWSTRLRQAVSAACSPHRCMHARTFAPPIPHRLATGALLLLLSLPGAFWEARAARNFVRASVVGPVRDAAIFCRGEGCVWVCV